jgi:hypothetical protein
MSKHIEELAVASGIYDSICDPYDALKNGDCYSSIKVDLEKFAALVAAHEREACAKVVKQIFDDLTKDNFVDSTAVANLICNFGDFVGKPLIEAIRARGEA